MQMKVVIMHMRTFSLKLHWNEFSVPYPHKIFHLEQFGIYGSSYRDITPLTHRWRNQRGTGMGHVPTQNL